MSKKTNITLKLDADLLKAVKVLAAQRGTSISALLTSKLEEEMKRNDEYEKAMNRSMVIMREGWNLGWQRPKSRDQLHER
jgi:Family of unknown function (DUF6364)